MSRRRVLLFHPALAPYRVDMFNALSRRCSLRLVLLAENVPNQAFDQAHLRSLLDVEPGYLLHGVTIAGRSIRTGFAGEISRFRPDVVVTSEFGQATLSVITRRRLRRDAYALVVSTEDNPWSVRSETSLHAMGRRMLQPYLDCVLTYSEEARAMYLERFRATQPVAASALVQNEQVFRARLDRAAAAARRLAEAHGLLGRRVLLYVGRLATEKRVDRLVNAARRLRATLPDLVLALVGDGPEREALARLAADGLAGGSVVLAGRLEGEALHAWYRLGTVFALASEREPFGAVVNEALLAGLPVVCSDRAGARSLITPGRNGAVVDAGDAAALDAALLAWLGREPAVSPARFAASRPSRTEITFDAAVEAYLAALDAASAHRRERTPRVT